MSRWRVGRQIPKNLYDGDLDVGRMDTAELAEKVVRAVNLVQQSPEEAATASELLDRLVRLKRDHEIDMETARRLNGQLRAERNRLIREEGEGLVEEGKRIAELIDREAYENSMVVGESPPEMGSYQAGRDGGIAYGLRRAAEIARRG